MAERSFDFDTFLADCELVNSSGHRYPISDSRGHRFHRPPFPDEIEAIDLRVGLENASAFAQALRTGQPQPTVAVSRLAAPCRRCRDYALASDGITVWATGPCPHADGFEVSAELAVPSGRLIVADDLRPLFDGFQDDYAEYDISYDWGLAATMRDAPAHDQVAIFYVGNTSPRLWREPDGALLIACTDVDSETLPGGGEQLASVTTDLWWVSLCDGAEFDRRRAESGQDIPHRFTAVAVAPGVWRFDYYGLRNDFAADHFDDEHAVQYARARLIRPL